METNNKIALAAGAAVLAIGVPYLLKLQRLANELETVTRARIEHVDLSGMKLRVDVTLKNPTGGALKIKFPFVKMLYGTGTFATSEVRNIDIDIPKYSEKQLDPIYVQLPLMTLATTAPDMLKEYRKNGKVKITVRTVTTLNNKVPYSKTDEMTI